MSNPNSSGLSKGILSDYAIKALCSTDAPEHSMIVPFSEKLREDGKISHGLSSFGYDALLAPEFKIFTNANNALVDPKNFSPDCFVDKTGDSCVIPPNGFMLGRTTEYFKIPKDILVLCIGKSTYARCGIIVNVTPLEPGWEGHVTLEIHNTTPLPAVVYANEGICQFIFIRGEHPPLTTYDTRNGKYMNQTGIVLPRISA